MDLSLAGLRQQYRSGALTPPVLVAFLRARIAADAAYNAWIYVLSDAELAGYFTALARLDAKALPLYGVPFAIKDNIDLAGIATTAACPDFAYVPAVSAFVVQRLIDAGAIPLGKTNLDQFATGLVGTRSPYGVCRNAHQPTYISGGSSSGSAVAVARGHAAFALGTDTAGSGRVPAAFNELVGWKPSRGRVSTSGIVPACRSLDCVSVFTRSVADAQALAPLLSGYDADDPWSRRSSTSAAFSLPESAPTNRRATDVGASAAPGEVATVGVPIRSQCQLFGSAYDDQLFERAVARVAALGLAVRELDIEPLLAAGRLLYQGPWLAERRLAMQEVLNTRPEILQPLLREILEPAVVSTAVETFAGIHHLAQLRRSADVLLDSVDALLLPTTGGCFTIEEVLANPMARNSELGHYTNFANLLDMAVVAVPAERSRDGLPFGVSFLHDNGSDERLLSLAARFCDEPADAPADARADAPADASVTSTSARGASHFHTRGGAAVQRAEMDLVVCGAHMSGLPLNHQLVERGGQLQRAASTAPCYRLYALLDKLPGMPPRPGLVRVNTQGVAVAVEVWRLPEAHVGSFLAGIPAPLGLGTVQLADGSSAKGFLCEQAAVEGVTEISAFGGWRAYVASLGRSQAD